MTFHQIVLQRKQCQITCYSSSYTNGCEVTGNFAKPVLKLDFLFNLLAEVRLQGERIGQVAFLSWSRARETLEGDIEEQSRPPVQGTRRNISLPGAVFDSAPGALQGNGTS